MGFKEIYKTYLKSFNEIGNDYFKNYNTTVTTNKELSEYTVYVIWWFNENGFSGRMTTNNTAKTEWEVTKEGTEDTFTLTATKQDPKRCDIKSYMEMFNKSFKLKQEIERLKRMKEER